MSDTRASIVVSGRVQGVSFRYFTQRRAEDLGVTGWVRNCDDGTVEALFEGEDGAVRQAIDACRQGPPAARVDRVEVDWQVFTGEFSGFSVRY